MKHKVLIFIYLGGSLLHFAKCYSDGNFGDNSQVCQTMEVAHNDYLPLTSKPPFTVDPDNITIVSSNLGKSFDGEVFIIFFIANELL